MYISPLDGSLNSAKEGINVYFYTSFYHYFYFYFYLLQGTTLRGKLGTRCLLLHLSLLLLLLLLYFYTSFYFYFYFYDYSLRGTPLWHIPEQISHPVVYFYISIYFYFYFYTHFYLLLPLDLLHFYFYTYFLPGTPLRHIPEQIGHPVSPSTYTSTSLLLHFYITSTHFDLYFYTFLLLPLRLLSTGNTPVGRPVDSFTPDCAAGVCPVERRR